MKTQTVIFEIITPHHEPVHIAGLLTDIEAVIKKHVILGEHAAAALAVWVLHTWTFELRDIVAYVAIESPEKRCGKTTLLSVLAAMASKPLIASNLTVGALFRAIDTCQPTLFIDEADTFMAGNSIMRGIINSGNTWRTAYVLRLSKLKQNLPQPPTENDGSRGRPLTLTLSPDGGVGKDVSGKPAKDFRQTLPHPGPLPLGEGELSADVSERRITRPVQSPNENPETGLKKYSCWCPKVIAMIGQVPDTIADRSIVVPMSRKLVTEACAPLAELNTEPIKAKCARFAVDAREAIAQAPKIRGAGLNDRAADTFDPLYVIARLAGEGWEEKLHAAALALNAAAQSHNSGTELILDILSIFILSTRERIFSRELAETLREGGCGLRSLALKYSALNEYRISQILRPYGIKPAAMRIGKEVNKGYKMDDFKEVIARYVPEDQIRAYIQDLRQRSDFEVQARAQAREEAALMEQVLAAAPKDHLMDVPEAMAIIRQLEKKPGQGGENVAGCCHPVAKNVAT